MLKAWPASLALADAARVPAVETKILVKVLDSTLIGGILSFELNENTFIQSNGTFALMKIWNDPTSTVASPQNYIEL